jgi:hypothetical protein
MKPIGLIAGVVAVMLSVVAPVASAAVDLESLLRVALNEGNSGLRWGLTDNEIQQLFGDEAKSAYPGNRQWVRDLNADLGKCQFVAHLYGSQKDGRLWEIQLTGVSGLADECHSQLSGLATRLYAQGPVVSRNIWGTMSPTGAKTGEGVVSSSSWETKTTCARLSSAAYGASFPSLNLAHTGCGPSGRNITARTPDPADVPARDADSVWESLLRIGLNAPDSAVRWDTPLEDLKRRFATNIKKGPLPPYVQFMLALSDGDCRYDVTFDESDQGVFRSIGLKQTAGSAQACRERMVTEISRLYGPRFTELDRSKWYLQRKTGARISGDIFAATWEARAACVTLAWYEGEGYTGARNDLWIRAVRGCGEELDGGLNPVYLIER